ncbi:GNAT family N-acetyltransferase [Amycolatopsis benzoatilytica]|uniref:GNAT family N-acetyltransferase n=1 Tax=Amycolatopsis benzoatilytica TaxID=346045 RepID=UPI001FE16D50|nr:GNAT family N-acetyltransferase [Amycolatopsis benzoatilytica]
MLIEETIRTWVAGWALSRDTPPPVEKPWGLHIEVPGNASEAGRHVLPRAEESLVRAAAEATRTPRTWLKTTAEPQTIEPWLTDGWAVAWEDTGHIMATDLQAANPVLADGYTASVRRRGAVTFVRVQDSAGEQAAKGQMAAVGEAVVVDRVVTESAHQRRGLGGFVMRTLANHALDDGAVLGVLGATDQGRALYETLGWKKHATLAEAVYRR